MNQFGLLKDKVNGLLVCDPKSVTYSEQVSNLILLQTFDIKYMDSKVVFLFEKKKKFLYSGHEMWSKQLGQLYDRGRCKWKTQTPAGDWRKKKNVSVFASQFTHT